MLRQSRTARDCAQPWPSLPLRRGAAHVSLPGLLPAARSTVINRGNDLASCLCLVNSDRVFSFLTHWACETKWVLVFRLVHLLDGNAERAPATCSWLFWKEKRVGPVHPSRWILCSEYRACMTLSLPLLVHSPFISESFLRALAAINSPSNKITFPPPLGTKKGRTLEPQRQRHLSERHYQIIGEENRWKMMLSLLQYQFNTISVSFAFN